MNRGRAFPPLPVTRAMNLRANGLYIARALEAGDVERAQKLTGESLRDIVALQRALSPTTKRAA